jgi:hypothetical protein
MALRVGAKVKVRYRLVGQRVDREGVAVYLGKNNQTGLRDFSGRPEFGTTSLRREDIISADVVPDDTKCYMDRKVKQ